MNTKENSASDELFEYWNQYRGRIVSRRGKWIAGKDVYSHGFSIVNELVGNITYMQMVILNATGRLVDKRLADWMENHFMCLSWPDSRIWCNHIGALAGTLHTSVVSATVAGVLGADSIMYGGSRTSIRGMAFIKGALRKFKSGKTVEEIVSKYQNDQGRPIITGFVRPVHGKDERIEPMEKVREALGFDVGEHLSLAFKISHYLEKEFGEGINVGGQAYAFCADQGISGEELYRIRALVVSSGVVACYMDEKEKRGESFLPLHCEDVEYQGPSIRALPKK